MKLQLFGDESCLWHGGGCGILSDMWCVTVWCVWGMQEDSRHRSCRGLGIHQGSSSEGGV